MLRKTQATTVDALCSAIGALLDRMLDRIGNAEFETYIRHCGYCCDRRSEFVLFRPV